MLSLTKSELTDLLQGQSTSSLLETSFHGVEFDSRQITEKVLFVALPGEKVHGQTFVEGAVKQGATLCLVEDAALLTSSPLKDYLVAVPNSLIALQTLGRYARQKFLGPVIGVTGTIGKTTTRNLLSAILQQKGSVNASKKSFNNHIGVPYTLCNSDSRADFTVLEMGMNHAGELTVLTEIAQPNVTIITNITPVHMEFFEDLNQVADAKCEIFSGLKNGGVAIINGDVVELKSATERWRSSNPQFEDKVLVFGTLPESDYVTQKVTDLLTEGFAVEISAAGLKLDLKLPFIGAYNATNLVAAVVMALQVAPDITQAQIQAALSGITPEAHRLNLLTLTDGRQILDDCYNSSPTALMSVLKLISKTKDQGKRVGLVLGGMHEMGAKAEHYHELVAQEILKLSPEFCFVVGEVGKLFLEPLNGANFPVRWFGSAKEVLQPLMDSQFDLALVKGSRGVKLDQLIESLPIAAASDE